MPNVKDTCHTFSFKRVDKIPRSQPSLPEIYIQLSEKLDQANLTTSKKVLKKISHEVISSYHLK